MGKHTAAQGAQEDPIVAAALAARHGDVHGAHSVEQAGDNPVGWPAPPAPGGGLGWPADAEGAPPVQEVRRGWRRLFGVGRVA